MQPSTGAAVGFLPSLSHHFRRDPAA